MLITESESEVKPNGIFETLRNITSIASLLRLSGALTVLAAMSAFLVQEWSAGDDISRYYLLLTQTLLLAVGGLGLSFLLKENKGARVFFGLGLLSLTANMTILGALVYSAIHGGSHTTDFPEFAIWKTMDFISISLALAATVVVSVPMALFSYRLLTRQSATTFTGIFAFSNFLLLIPVRESLPLGLLVLMAVVVPAQSIFNQLKTNSTLRTPEGIFAMTTLLIPAVLIVIRSLWFYSTDILLVLTLSGIAFAALRLWVSHATPHSLTKSSMQSLSLVSAIVIAFCAGELLQPLLSENLLTCVMSATLAVLMLDMAKRSDNASRLITCASLLLVGAPLFMACTQQDVMSGGIALIAGVAAVFLGKAQGLHQVVRLGVVTMIVALFTQSHHLHGLIDFSNWVTLSVLGATIIIAASIIERHGALLLLKWKSFGLVAKE